MKVNKYNLSREIPDPIKRSIRQRCGFGCVICGNAIYQYEHFNPEYNEATQHSPEGITLLCGGCHDRKTRGLLSVQTIIEANKNPKTLAHGFSWGPFDIGITHPEIVMGIVTMTETDIPLRVFGDNLFVISSPLLPGEIFKISANLKNSQGETILCILENEWQTSSDNWDCTVEGTRITIRSESRSIDLVLRVEPPNKIIIERLHMEHLGCTISCSEGKPLNIKSTNINMETNGAKISKCKVGIDINASSIGLALGGGVYVSDLRSW